MKKFFAAFLVIGVAGLCLLLSRNQAEGVTPCFRTVSLRQNYGYNAGYGYAANYGYQATNYQHYDQNVLIVGVPVSNLGVPYYWSVGDDLREDRIAKKTAEILRRESKPVTGREPRKPPSPDGGAQAKPADSPLPSRFDIIGGGGDKPVVAGKRDAEVLAIFETSCSSCHKPGKALKGITLLREDGQIFHEKNFAAEAKYRFRVYDSVFGGEGVNLMPKNASPLGNDKVETIRNWQRELMEE